MMASIDDSGSPQYRGFQPIPDGLSNRQRDKHLQDCLRSAFVLIAELQMTVTELTLQNLRSATSPTVSTPSTTLGTPSTVRMASTPGKLAGSPYKLAGIFPFGTPTAAGNEFRECSGSSGPDKSILGTPKYLPEAQKPVAPSCPVPMPLQMQAPSSTQMPPTSQVNTQACSHGQRSGPAGPDYSSDDLGYFTCTRTDGCPFEHFDFDVVKRHEQQCKFVSAKPAASFPARPAVVPASGSIGPAATNGFIRRPDHAARIRTVLQARLIAQLLRSSLRGNFRAWRRLHDARPVRFQHRSDDELSVVSASSSRKEPRHEHRRKRGQRQARRPPDRHGSGSDASNEGRKGAIGFNKDFPYINAKAACIKCGDGWMPGYWHRGVRVTQRGFTRKYDPLADKIMCDHCRNKYPLGPYYFPEYEPYVTESAVARVRAESSSDYVDLAKAAASCYDDYRNERDKVSAAEHAEVHANALPDDASAEDIFAHVPAYDAEAAVRSALTTWVDVARARIAASMAYDEQHAEACAAVLPIIGQVVRDAEHVSTSQGTEPLHWCFTDPVPPLGSGSARMDRDFNSCGYTYKSYWARITTISSRLNGYPWLASWLRG